MVYNIYVPTNFAINDKKGLPSVAYGKVGDGEDRDGGGEGRSEDGEGGEAADGSDGEGEDREEGRGARAADLKSRI